jgi:hypothetical protein
MGREQTIARITGLHGRGGLVAILMGLLPYRQLGEPTAGYSIHQSIASGKARRATADAAIVDSKGLHPQRGFGLIRYSSSAQKQGLRQLRNERAVLRNAL